MFDGHNQQMATGMLWTNNKKMRYLADILYHASGM